MTLRFTARWPGDPWRAQELRAWLRRPDRLRVETVDGALVQVVHDSPRQVGVLTSADERYTTTLPWWTESAAAQPVLRADGLVAARSDRFSGDFSYDAPMYRDYFWVAMLGPAELADGRDPDTGMNRAGTDIEAVYRGGAWRAYRVGGFAAADVGIRTAVHLLLIASLPRHRHC
jgi:hypothetical protein